MDENRVIAYLARHYRSVLARRALWAWSGGAEEDVDFDLPPQESWRLLWEKAAADPGPTRVDLVREMLFDSPGEKDLLGYLDTLALEQFRMDKDIAELFLYLLNKNGMDEKHLPVLLYLFQESSPDAVLATTAPALQTVRAENDYNNLENTLAKLKDTGVTLSAVRLTAWIGFYLKCLPRDDGAADIQQKTAVAQKCLSELRAHIEGTAAQAKTEEVSAADGAEDPEPGDTEDRRAVFAETFQKLCSRIEDLKVDPAAADIGFFKPAVGAIAGLLQLLGECGLDETKIALRLSAAGPLRAALWATRNT
jgi:hypothetical protein